MIRTIFVISPLVALGLAVFILGFQPISSAMYQANSDRTSLLSQRDRLVSRLEDLLIEKPQGDQTSFIWNETSINQATLNLQSLLSQISGKHDVPILLLGPKVSSKEGKLARFTVEFETETSLKSAVKILSKLEQAEPAVGIASLDIRHVSKFNPDKSEVTVYMRMVVWGWMSNEVN